jgi:hypothetical protein
MPFTFIDLLSASYLVAGLAFAAVYVPRIRCMLSDDWATARSHSVCAETLWALCRLVTLVYVATVAEQPLITLSVGLDCAGRAALLVVLLRARVRCGLTPRFT